MASPSKQGQATMAELSKYRRTKDVFKYLLFFSAIGSYLLYAWRAPTLTNS
jgi:hypothetical protein